jgi:hypothetical protein
MGKGGAFWKSLFGKVYLLTAGLVSIRWQTFVTYSRLDHGRALGVGGIFRGRDLSRLLTARLLPSAPARAAVSYTRGGVAVLVCMHGRA